MAACPSALHGCPKLTELPCAIPSKRGGLHHGGPQAGVHVGITAHLVCRHPILSCRAATIFRVYLQGLGFYLGFVLLHGPMTLHNYSAHETNRKESTSA